MWKILIIKTNQTVIIKRSLDLEHIKIRLPDYTNSMISATKNLFYAISAKGVTKFNNPDNAALAFTMGVHSILDFEYDAKNAQVSDADGLMENYIEEFCRIYSKEE